MARKTGGVAGSDGGPGEESETGEARGTQVEAISSRNATHGSTKTERSHIGFGRILDSLNAREHQAMKRRSQLYTPYREVYLNAKQAYAEAVERDRIPVRYRQRVKDYLDAIANASE